VRACRMRRCCSARRQELPRSSCRDRPAMAQGTPGCGPAHCALEAGVQPGTGRPVSVARVRHAHERGLRGVWRRVRGRHRPSYRSDAVGRRLGLPRMPRGRFEGPSRPGRRGSGRCRCPRVRPARSGPASKIDDRSTRRAFTCCRCITASRSCSRALGDDVIGRLADVSPTLGCPCRKAAERWHLKPNSRRRANRREWSQP